MTPQEKAKELFNKMQDVENINGFLTLYPYEAIQCSLIAVDEILGTFPTHKGEPLYKDHIGDFTYWQQVKEELIKMQTT